MSEAIRTLHSWTRAEYEHMVDVGGFHPGARLELLDGEIIDMSSQKSAHAAAVALVAERLRDCFDVGFHIRGQMPLALDDRSEPEPDVAVVPGGIRDYVDRHPRTAVLIVEVADSSLVFDRTRKAAAYCRNRIPEYWILNLSDRALEVHRVPTDASYRERRVLGDRDSVTPLAAPDCQVGVAELLP